MTHALRMPDDHIRLDLDRLGHLIENLGPAEAEALVRRALDRLDSRLTELGQLARSGVRPPELVRLARGLAAIAEQIGMSKLARVARDVSVCAERGDEAALGATLARLQRVGERSRAALLDLAPQAV
ncbi:hypothetical protein RM543_00040 [Roseicyclus sp. F158]|uniref:HPt domain-containing protein n=1 Tax=Tropicimonas omnivorans TaxID=3075590 RepID=A0ABU3DD21_9RHOB|nr:hypothetical protein [Roseicyclus sp. F158]MDT0681057.1 hypothetical protein [Roseicyclus sp. F158]